MARPNHTPRLAHTEEASHCSLASLRTLRASHPPCPLLRIPQAPLTDSEAIVLFYQLPGVEGERSFLRNAQRFFSHLFPEVVELHPSSFHRRVRKLRRFWNPCGGMSSPRWSATRRRCSSTLRHFRFCTSCLGPSGLGLLRCGAGEVEAFSVHGAKLHLICSTNGIPTFLRTHSTNRLCC
jgi:hypothetical protein